MRYATVAACTAAAQSSNSDTIIADVLQKVFVYTCALKLADCSTTQVVVKATKQINTEHREIGSEYRHHDHQV